MGIENRDYIRNTRSYAGDWGIDLTPVVKWIIIVNVAVFLLQMFWTREQRRTPRDMLREANPKLYKRLVEAEQQGPEAVEKLTKKYPGLERMNSDDPEDAFEFGGTKTSVLQEWFELDSQKVIHGQIWRLLTHAFCHDRMSPFHILFNMIFLYWFGRTLESMYGCREFLLFYLAAAVAGGLAFVGLQLYTHATAPAIGASGAVMGVVMLYTMHFPREIIRVWFFSVEMRWVLAFYLIMDLHPVLMELAGERSFGNIANAAHLGGLAFGFLYAKLQWRLEPLVERLESLRWQLRNHGRFRVLRPQPFVRADTDAEPDPERVDALLQKIMESGRSSLTEEELEVLRETSARLKQRQREE
jgi:membrane associated rhomboid family serine protease